MEITLDCGHSGKALRCEPATGNFYCALCGARYCRGGTRRPRSTKQTKGAKGNDKHDTRPH